MVQKVLDGVPTWRETRSEQMHVLVEGCTTLNLLNVLDWRPLIFVLANASFDDLLHFRNGHLVEAARLHPLQETQNPE